MDTDIDELGEIELFESGSGVVGNAEALARCCEIGPRVSSILLAAAPTMDLPDELVNS
ncbi:MAG: hypothetical protein ACJAQ9_000793 [Ilumatobacter sp.]|jgi:hypothetical protein|tara:strand:+ start:83 stop:256 length:174 start_codon:yes stop_codon:yes gene_type:complete